MRRFVMLMLAAAPTVPLGAQAPAVRLAFEATSVKPNNSGSFARELGPAPGGHFRAINVPTRDLIAFAYGVSQDVASFGIVSVPKWVEDERYNVDANVPGTWTPDQMREMVRTMLADRFKLLAHRESRDLPEYSLVVAADKAPKLHRSQVDEAACNERRAAIQRREPIQPPVPGAPPICGTGRTSLGTITAVGFSIDSLSMALTRFAGRIVTNNTKLTGLWDYELTWTPEQVPATPPGAPAINIDPNGPSIFAALQEQLGLKLGATHGPVDVIVIDHVERPTED